MVTFPHHARRCANLLALGIALMASGACGGGGSEPTPPRAVVATVSVTGFPPTIYVGSSLQLAVSTLDANGAVLSGRTITYSSNNNSVASVSPGGVVTAVSVGSAIVHVLSEGKSADVAVNVAVVPVSTVALTPATGRVSMFGGTLQLTGIPRDSAGSALAGRTVTWTSSASRFATVSSSGLVTGVAEGSTVIRATSEGRFGEAIITVSSAAAPTISSITPSVLTPGITATITGTGFNGVTTGNTVTIDGTTAAITAASTTQLTIAVPALSCLPVHSARVQVITDGLAGVALQPVRVASAISIAANTPVLLSSAEAGCAELPASTGKYLVSVVNLAKASGIDQSATTSFRLTGALPPASLASAVATPSMLRQPIATTTTHTMLPAGIDPLGSGASRTAAERTHEMVLESSIAAVTRLRASRASRQSQLSSRSLVPAARNSAAVPNVGETRKFRVAQFTTSLTSKGSCSDFVEITARAVYIGSRAVIYEDVAAPLKNTMDDVYQNLGKEFDTSMYVSDSTYFGDPLATDARTDNDHHLNMVFTPSVSKGIAGFVTGCDFFPRDSSAVPANDDRVSNFGEYFYAIVPTVAGTGFKAGNTADSWLRGMRGVIVHEVKHIASVGARLANNATGFEESWLEEGMARHAEELWQRNYIYGVDWKADTKYQQSLFCDVRPTVPACTGKPFDMFGVFATLYDVLDNPGASSLFGRTRDNDFNFYASTWSFVRYTLDRYATSEASFLRGITQSTTTAGLASISAQTGGHSSTELITNWSLAMYMDDLTSNKDLSVPTWHMHDIYAGMNLDFSTAAVPSFVKPYPLTPTEPSSASFTVNNAGIFNGSFAMYLVPGNASGTSTIQLSGVTGAGAGSLRLALVRLP